MKINRHENANDDKNAKINSLKNKLIYSSRLTKDPKDVDVDVLVLGR